MKLSAKATRFILEALDHYQKYQDKRVDEDALSEDELSDLQNDLLFLQSIKEALQNYHNELIVRRRTIKTDV